MAFFLLSESHAFTLLQYSDKKKNKKKIFTEKIFLCVIMLVNLDRMLMHLLREREGDDAVISDAQLSTLHEENKLILPKQTVRTQKGGGVDEC